MATVQKCIAKLTAKLGLTLEQEINPIPLVNSRTFWASSPFEDHSPHHDETPHPLDAPLIDIKALVRAHRRWCKCQHGEGCYIDRAAPLWSGVRVPSDGPIPPTYHKPSSIDEKDEAFVREWLDKQIKSRVVVPVDPLDPTQCHTVSPIFVTAASKLRLRGPTEEAIFGSGDHEVAVTDIIRLAEQRAQSIFLKIPPGPPRTIAKAIDKVWKEEGSEKRRIVLDLSVSINRHSKEWPFKYHSIDQLSDGWTPEDRMYSCDLSQGFHQLQIHPEHRKYFCFQLPDNIITAGEPNTFQYTRLPFGWSISPSIFASLTNEVQLHITNNAPPHLRNRFISFYYVDDLCLRSHSSLIEPVVSWSKDALHEIKAVTNEEKETPPTKVIVFCGRIFDSPRQEVSVAPRTLFTTLCTLYLITLLYDTPGYEPALSLKRAQSVAGKVGWLAELYYSGRLYSSGLWYPCAEATRRGWEYLNLRSFPGYIENVIWWLEESRKGTLRGHKLIKPQAMLVDFTKCPSVSDIGEGSCKPSHSRSDASGNRAWSIIIRNHVLWATFSQRQRGWSIQAKELYPVLRLLQWGGRLLAGSFLAITTDNISNVFSINKGKGKGITLDLLRLIFKLCDTYSIDIVALWLPREVNVLTDALSKSTHLLDACRTTREYDPDLEFHHAPETVEPPEEA